MKVNTKWNLGNFSVALSSEVDANVLGTLESFGLLYLGQRNSEVDKVLGAFEKGADGKSKRKAGWKRMDVDYSATLAEALAKTFGELKVDDATTLECDVVITQYVPTKVEPKFQREKLKFAEKESTEEGLEAWLGRFARYAGPTHGEDKEYAVEALAAAKRAIDEFLAKNI